MDILLQFPTSLHLGCRSIQASQCTTRVGRICCLWNADLTSSTERTRSVGRTWLACQYPSQKQEDLVCCNMRKEPPILQSRSMEETYELLANRLVTTTLNLGSPNSKYLIGIAGSPGAGKSTVAKEVASRVNKLWSARNSTESAEIAIVVPMDGFHLYRWQLDAMEDPAEAHARRGAPWTFDPASLAKSLATLQNEGQAYFPSFDHGVGDPIEQDIFVSPKHKLVLVEGNYLLLAEGKWKQLATFFNERWFIDIEIEEAMKRVEERHIATGKTPRIAKSRVDYNDRLNARIVSTSRRFADLVITSIDKRMGEKNNPP
ncbi:hypothetical protein O6H91_12G077600 [Diphasiastrum complanatum]|uniref:Uncharacterized protein n=1 Tax=Diphasiastrum complanatum TaxID=34168 RepID=A0ACC2C3T3_DIPCM|nr:hypothetical protein O6H91_12G077600 [Diphasiastrum complanatum]